MQQNFHWWSKNEGNVDAAFVVFNSDKEVANGSFGLHGSCTVSEPNCLQ